METPRNQAMLLSLSMMHLKRNQVDAGVIARDERGEVMAVEAVKLKGGTEAGHAGYLLYGVE